MELSDDSSMIETPPDAESTITMADASISWSKV